ATPTPTSPPISCTSAARPSRRTWCSSTTNPGENSDRQPRLDRLLGGYMRTLLGHRALHEQDQNDERHGQDGEQPENVEVGHGRRLLLAEIRQRLPGHPL